MGIFRNYNLPFEGGGIGAGYLLGLGSGDCMDFGAGKLVGTGVTTGPLGAGRVSDRGERWVIVGVGVSAGAGPW